DDDVEALDGLRREDALDLAHGWLRLPNGHMLNGHVAGSLLADASRPRRILFDGEDAARPIRPPARRLTTTELEDVPVLEVPLGEKVDRRIRVPRDGLAVGRRCRHAEAAAPMP